MVRDVKDGTPRALRERTWALTDKAGNEEEANRPWRPRGQARWIEVRIDRKTSMPRVKNKWKIILEGVMHRGSLSWGGP